MFQSSKSSNQSNSTLLQSIYKSWLNRKSSTRRINDASYKRIDLNLDLPLHEQIKNRAIYSLVSTIEPHFEIIHDLLIWKYPDQTIVAFLMINLGYWLIVFLSSHLVSAIAFIVFLYQAQKFWSTVVWPEIALEPPTPPSEQENWTCVDSNLLSAPEIARFVDSLIDWTKNRLIDHWHLRSTNHLAFFLINLVVFSLLGWLGTAFSGALIIWFLLMATLLAPGITLHLYPFIKTSSSKDEKCEFVIKQTTEQLAKSNECEMSEKVQEKNCTSKQESSFSKISSDNCENDGQHFDLTKYNENKCENENENGNNHHLMTTSTLFGDVLKNTKCFFDQMFDDKTLVEPNEEFIKQKETKLNKAFNFLTDMVLNQDPTVMSGKNELNASFKYIQDEFKKLNKLKETMDIKPTNSIESNLVPSYFENSDSPNGSSSDCDEDFEIIN